MINSYHSVLVFACTLIIQSIWHQTYVSKHHRFGKNKISENTSVFVKRFGTNTFWNDGRLCSLYCFNPLFI